MVMSVEPIPDWVLPPVGGFTVEDFLQAVVHAYERDSIANCYVPVGIFHGTI